MFRLAIARTSRAYAPGLTRCRRFKSDIPKAAASTSDVKKPKDTPPTPITPKTAPTQHNPKKGAGTAKRTPQSEGPLSAATPSSGIAEASAEKPKQSTENAEVGQSSATDESANALGSPEKPWSPHSRFNPKELPLSPEYEPQTEEEYHAMLVHGRSLHPAYSHPKTHGIPVAIIHFRSHFPHLLTLFTHVALHAAAYLGIPTSGVISLPTQRSLWTVLRSPFIHKKSQENFERRVHKRAIKAWDADPEVVERWAQYLRKRRIGGVGMRVVKWVHVEVGIGRTRLQHVEMGDDATVSSEKIRSLGDAIAQEELATPPKAAKKTPASPN